MSEPRPIGFNAGQSSGIDDLAGGSSRFYNVLVDGAGVVRSRPGIATWDDFPASAASADPVIGMALFGDKIVYVTDDRSDLSNPVRRVYCWMGFDRGDVLAITDEGDATTFVDGDSRPVLVVFRNSVVIVAGGAPQRVTSGLVSQRLGGSPPDAIDAVVVSQYLVLNLDDDSGQFVWAGPGEDAIETWDTGIDFREAEYRPDPLVAVTETSRELWALGTKTLQGYEPDPEQVWAPAFAVDLGISAPRSVIAYEGMRAWLDHNKRFVLTNGRDVGPGTWISSPAMDKTIQQLENIEDCWGFRAKIEGHDILTWVLPTEGRSFVYDVVSKTWGEWFSFENGEWVPLKIYSHLWWPENNLHLIGLGDGRIGRLTFDATTDLGQPLKWTVRSGFDSSKTSGLKDPKCVKITMRRGDAADADAAIQLRWRDDPGSWSEPISLTYGTTGDTRPTVEARPVGEPYDVREYEISTTADVATSLIEAWEDVDILEA